LDNRIGLNNSDTSGKRNQRGLRPTLAALDDLHQNRHEVGLQEREEEELILPHRRAKKTSQNDHNWDSLFAQRNAISLFTGFCPGVIDV
jgi:hypothetical protein